MRAGRRADAHLDEPEPVPFDPETLAVLLFTSGTSGPAKGAMLSHRALLANLAQLQRLDPEPIVSDDVVLLVLPLFHIYALNAVLGLSVAVGARSILRAAVLAGAAPSRPCSSYDVTNIPAAPQVFVAWSTVPDLDHQLAGVRTLVSGAAPLAPAVFAAFADLAGQPVWEGYGLTEAAPVVSSTMVGRRAKPGCVGSPLPGVEIRFVDESGEESDEEDPGEILVRGANLFSGLLARRQRGPGRRGLVRHRRRRLPRRRRRPAPRRPPPRPRSSSRASTSTPSRSRRSSPRTRTSPRWRSWACPTSAPARR